MFAFEKKNPFVRCLHLSLIQGSSFAQLSDVKLCIFFCCYNLGANILPCRLGQCAGMNLWDNREEESAPGKTRQLSGAMVSRVIPALHTK